MVVPIFGKGGGEGRVVGDFLGREIWWFYRKSKDCPVLKKVYRLEDRPAPGLRVKTRPGIGLQFLDIFCFLFTSVFAILHFVDAPEWGSGNYRRRAVFFRCTPARFWLLPAWRPPGFQRFDPTGILL